MMLALGSTIAGMDSTLYIKLSALMFLEFAVWGAWYSVLAPRLLGPLKFSGKQTGWIYATIPLGSIFMPLVAGQLADQSFNTEVLIAVAHIIGSILLFVSAWNKKFSSLFIVMFLYALCYTGSLPLVYSLMNRQLAENNVDPTKSAYIFMWAPIAWALVGYFLSGWRWKFKTAEKGRDCLFLGAILSVVMVLITLTMPKTPPLSSEPAMFKALSMLGNLNFLVFIIVSLAAAGTMQFYFLATAQFMGEHGIPQKNVPAAMAIAQAVQAAATLFLLEVLTINIGYKWTLTVGILGWLVLYLIYMAQRPRWLIVVGQSFHGLAYVFFIVAGIQVADRLAATEIKGSVQAILATATTGIGLFIGTHLTGIAMDKFRREDRFQWSRIFAVPAVILAVCIVVFVVLFQVQAAAA